MSLLHLGASSGGRVFAVQRAALEELLAVGLGGLADVAAGALVDSAFRSSGVEGSEQLALGERGAVENRVGEGGRGGAQTLVNEGFDLLGLRQPRQLGVVDEVGEEQRFLGEERLERVKASAAPTRGGRRREGYSAFAPAGLPRRRPGRGTADDDGASCRRHTAGRYRGPSSG